MAALLLFFYDTVEQEDFPFLLTAQKFCVTFLYCYLLVPIFLLLKNQSQSDIISDFCFQSLFNFSILVVSFFLLSFFVYGFLYVHCMAFLLYCMALYMASYGN